MNVRKIVMAMTILALLAGTFSMTGCSNTWKGAGKDVEKTGESMQGK